ncbi:RNA polymerase Rpb4-domain-containing protein [Multifurca ochricompacta]|uniref:DNA-directed RNA polymerase III subunit RPC9 n=1 Tax=Multifurca ochricompacta TaxID=376703 RepID=A0AAD4M1V7_9AGAM|nr:RNA polymerase Rpb4-domain-containing protein [Multifurca ochricompacta]
MEILNSRAALLSNYEVLQLLKELEADHIARTRTAQRLKKEEEDAAAATGLPPPPIPDPLLAISENLRTIEVEAIQYLTADYQPTRVQTAQGVERLTKNLAPFGLTKAEKLQVVNLIPVEPVELYVIVEELEDRLRNCMEEVLNIVRSSIAPLTPSSSSALALLPLTAQPPLEIVEETPSGGKNDGVGIEDDLDVEDDE